MNRGAGNDRSIKSKDSTNQTVSQRWLSILMSSYSDMDHIKIDDVRYCEIFKEI